MTFRESLAGEIVFRLESRLAEIPRRQRAEAVEDGEIRDGADVAVLVRERPETFPAHCIRDRFYARRIGDGNAAVAANRDRLQILRAHDRADAAAPGVPPLVADRREAHAV